MTIKPKDALEFDGLKKKYKILSEKLRKCLSREWSGYQFIIFNAIAMGGCKESIGNKQFFQCYLDTILAIFLFFFYNHFIMSLHRLWHEVISLFHEFAITMHQTKRS